MNKDKNLLFVTEESINGVFTVINSLIESWPEKENQGTTIYLLSNKGHWGKSQLLEMSKSKSFSILDCPIYTASDLNNKIKNFNKASKLIMKAAFKIFLPFYSIWAIPKLMYLLKSRNITSIYSHNGGHPGGFLPRAAIYAGKLSFIKNVFLIIHNYPAPRKIWIYSYLRDKLIAFCSSKIISVSYAVSKSLTTSCYFSKDIQIIHNGIPVEKKSIDLKISQQPRWIGSKNIIGFIGELVERKGIHILIEALSQISLDYKLVIYGVGDENYTKKLKELVIRKKMKNKVFFEGYNQYAPHYLKDFTLLALPSIAFESLPMTILEAMKHSKAVVCSDVGGTTEMVDNNLTGIVVKPGEILDLKNAIEKLLSNPKLTMDMGNRGFIKFNNSFNVIQVAQKYNNLNLAI